MGTGASNKAWKLYLSSQEIVFSPRKYSLVLWINANSILMKINQKAAPWFSKGMGCRGQLFGCWSHI